MPEGGEEMVYRRRENLGPHLRYFEARCMEKGASRRKAERWAWRQVRKGKRMPEDTDGR